MTDQDTDYTARLSQLRKNESNYPENPEQALLETFDNRYAHRPYEISFNCPEFTARCPMTNQPDFGSIKIEYCPDKTCIESKSLKMYLFAYRNHNTFHEEAVNRILDDIVAACAPRYAVVTGDFNARGGIAIHVEAAYQNEEDLAEHKGCCS
jgi:7-cyano-7-deazaguanine reductase